MKITHKHAPFDHYLAKPKTGWHLPVAILLGLLLASVIGTIAGVWLRETVSPSGANPHAGCVASAYNAERFGGDLVENLLVCERVKD
jgi:hypothetical protein